VDHLTTLMITHNMRDALRFGNRLIMMHCEYEHEPFYKFIIFINQDSKKQL
jgi:ABC-type uncharacterized transport system ATPase component